MSNIARCSSTPLIELIEPDGSGAIPKKAGIDVANNHLGYAITWFGMSIVSAFLLKKGIVRGNRRFL